MCYVRAYGNGQAVREPLQRAGNAVTVQRRAVRRKRAVRGQTR